MAEPIPVTIALSLIKAIVCVYDVVTLPIYTIAQKPWIKRSKFGEIYATKENEDNPYSCYVKKGKPLKSFNEATTLVELFSLIVKKYRYNKAFGYREVFGEEDERQPDGKVFRKLIMGKYIWFTFEQIDERIENLAKGLMEYGVKPGDTVMILAETRLEWYLMAQAVFRLGANISTLYSTLGPDAILHGINETRVTHLVTTFDLLPTIKDLITKAPLLKCIIYIEGYKPAQLQGINIQTVAFSKVEETGKLIQKSRFVKSKPDDPAIIMYTSGSTGVPKGVIITHKNVLATINGFYPVAHSLENKDHIYMAFLPLAHVLELAAQTFFLSIGVQVGYSSPHTMTDKSTAIKKGSQGDASILRPTLMAAVPLVLDRIRKAVTEQVESRGSFFKSFFNFTMDYKKFWSKQGFETPLVNRLICQKISALVGGRIQYVVTGSAPLSPETHDFIRSCLNVTLIQGYGLTETAAGATLMELDDLSVGRVGAPLSGVKIKLVDWREGNYYVTDTPNPRGEIVIGGDCVTAGYYKNEELTRESFRVEDGTRWFYTGDVGEIHPDGSIKIIDRKKDLVKLQFGEYISLGKIEADLKSCSVVENICIHGDSFHTYVVALVAPNEKVIRNIAKELNKENMPMKELLRDREINEAVLKMLAVHGRKAGLNKAEIPLRVKLCSEEWSPTSGLVTAAMKIRRKNIMDFYKVELNSLYNKNEQQSKST